MLLCRTGKAPFAMGLAAALAIPQFCTATTGDERPARVEFRILADLKHDGAAALAARAPESIEHPPAGYRWVRLGQVVTGSDPAIASKRLTVPGAHWENGEFAAAIVRLTGKNLAGSDLSKDFEITSNTADTLQLRPDPALYLRSVSAFQIDQTTIGRDNLPGKDFIVRDVPATDGRVRRLILVKLDRYNVTDKDFTRVVADFDEYLRPAIRFELSREAAKRFGALTREHLPDANGKWKYRMGIILHGRLLSAPELNSEIRDAGIIEGGKDGFKREEVELILETLRGPRQLQGGAPK